MQKLIEILSIFVMFIVLYANFTNARLAINLIIQHSQGVN